MKILITAALVFLFPLFFINPSLADICTDIQKELGFELNEAECYVLEQLEKRNFANLKNKFPNEQDRVLRAVFFRKLLTGAMPSLEVTEEGVTIWYARVREALNFKGAKLPFSISLNGCFFEEKANFIWAQFSADADFGESQFSAGADFEHAQFSGKAYFHSTQFLAEADFEHAQFSGETSFGRAQFSAEANFIWTQFSADAEFVSVQFSGKADFGGAQFSDEAAFGESQFSAEAHFVESQFSDRVNFGGAKFFAWADFNRVQFSGKAYFHHAQFSAFALFGGTKFLAGAHFLFAQFSAEAHFRKTQFSAKTNFSMVQFSDKADFREAQFSDEVSFIETQFSDKADFRVAQFSNVAVFLSCKFKDSSNFRYCQYHNKVNFDDVTGFSNMQMEWNYKAEKFGKKNDDKYIERRGLKGYLQYNETFYIALIKNYQEMGWFREADDCYYTYRVEKRKHRLKELNKQRENEENNSISFSRLWERAKLYGEWFLLDLTFGYGVKPKKIFLTFLVFWAFFIPLYAILLRHQWRRKLFSLKDLYRRPLRSAVFSLDTLTPGVNFRSEATLPPYTFSNTGYKKSLFNFCIRFQQILGWYWAALFLILFSRIWIR